MNTRCCWARAFLFLSHTQTTERLHCMPWQHTHLLKYFTMCMYLLSGTHCVFTLQHGHTFSASLMHPPHTHIPAHIGHALLRLLLSSFFFSFSLLHKCFPTFQAICLSFYFLLQQNLLFFLLFSLISPSFSLPPSLPLLSAFFTSLIHFICSFFCFLSHCIFYFALFLCFPHLLSHASPFFHSLPPPCPSLMSMSLCPCFLYFHLSVSHLLMPSFPSCLPILPLVLPPWSVSLSRRCRMCAVTFFSKSDMQIHSKSHTEAKPHKCPHCSKSFANSSYLAQHIRIHSGAKPYTCSYCQKSFRQLSHLQQHTRNHTESKPHKCPHCTKSFANSSYLAQHIRIHTGVKPYTCSFCQKSFRQLSHLQQHNRIHTGDRPYKCVHTGCEKSFTQLSNLQSHRRQHNKDKPFKCTNCNRGYTDAGSLEVHLSTHTVKHAKLYSCGLCNRTYTSETYLVKHMQKHNSDPLTAAAVAAAQHSQQNQQNQSHTQNQGGAHGRGEGTDSGAVRAGGQGGDHGQGQNQGSYSQAETASCPFDLHQYKTVAAGDIQFKSVSVADLATHKDLCLTVATSTIQVEHLNS
uniref:C2H2-type domain-containing protein n=1 Tax=Oncorhynchus tshawytscha TaxID=74940 RepID=A0AAZ3SFG7_ONCTS